MTNACIKEIKECSMSDSVLPLLRDTILQGWPNERKNCPKALGEYWNYRDELVVQDRIIFKGCRIVVPTILRPAMLQRIHTGHLGREKCKRRARQTLFWPNMNKDIENVVDKCGTCITHRPVQQSEPLLSHDVEECKGPWMKVATDIMELDHRYFLLVVDYYSNYPEVAEIPSASSKRVGQALKGIFARHTLVGKKNEALKCLAFE